MPLKTAKRKAATNMPSQAHALQALRTARDKIEQAIAHAFNGDPKTLAAYALNADDHELASLFEHAMRTKGKRVRGWLLIEWYHAHGGTNEHAALQAAVLIEAIHTASLLIDDVQDNSPLRRGEPTLLAERGAPVAISTGLSMLFGAANAARSLPNGEIVQPLVLNYVAQLAHGQAKDVTWHRDGNLTVTQEAYERMCAEKTGKLFTLAIQMAEAIAGVAASERALRTLRKHAPTIKQYFPDKKEHALNALELAGVIYQLADDVANITTDLGKELGEDIRERKITALTLEAMRNNATKKAVHAYYQKRGVNPDEVNALITLLSSSGVIDAVRERICTLYGTATRELTRAQLPSGAHHTIETLLELAASR